MHTLKYIFISDYMKPACRSDMKFLLLVSIWAQGLGALAESAVANGDVGTATAIAQIFAESIRLPEDGWMFEARQGCAARANASVTLLL